MFPRYKNKKVELIGNNLLIKNSFINLFGYIFPALVAIITLPILINFLGIERFGVLSLAWMITGYFSFFDFGIGRALVKLLSENLSLKKQIVNELIWTAIIITIFIGIIISLSFYLSSSFLTYRIFKIPFHLQDEVKKSFNILSISIPIILLTIILRGILESYQRFVNISILRIIISSLIYIGPLLVSIYSNNIFYIVSLLVIIRLIELIFYVYFCKSISPDLFNKFKINQSLIIKYLNFGVWMMISNIINPLMYYIDRFTIAAIISLSALTYYIISMEIIIRMMIIPSAICGVLFPAMSYVLKTNKNHAVTLFYNGIKFTFIVILPIFLCIFFFAREGLTVWLGEEFAEQGANILRILMIGGLINSLSFFPFSMLHAAGRPDITAKLHIIESPLYLALIWILTTKFGVLGAAIAWTSKTTIDNILLFYLVSKELKITYPKKKTLSLSLIIVSFLIITVFIPEILYIELIFIIFFSTFISFYIWNKVLNKNDQKYLILKIKNFKLFKNE